MSLRYKVIETKKRRIGTGKCTVLHESCACRLAEPVVQADLTDIVFVHVALCIVVSKTEAIRVVVLRGVHGGIDGGGESKAEAFASGWEGILYLAGGKVNGR